ncbi:hypothetical protein D9757_013522 [Collybiopsis confluens]|uniref:Polynucleotide 5'-hydroxyl-kinase GRC3 n=1 Tax=Collybiopsis confluens TaxID=2823264 RepID=A0A8H5G1F2_9AGAR|nr:hypothetical protein D9757_013522 [Collybiopsis confluens]
MLSAIAARKAAAASNVPELIGVSTPTPSSSTPPSTRTNTPTSKPNSKRKRSQVASQTSASASSKRKKGSSKKLVPPRYFAAQVQPQADGADGFRDQEDVIDMERLDSDDFADSDGAQVEDALEAAFNDAVDDSDGSTKKGSKRSYSPSRPAIVDSSEDEDDNDAGTSAHSRKHFGEENVSLTSFLPVEEQNTFYLTSEEVFSILSFAPSSSNSTSQTGTLVALQTSETLTLLGTCGLTVLHGSIHVNGAVLQSDPCRTHRMFAPRSSPLPCLYALPVSHPSSPSSLNLPARIDSAAVQDRVLVLLQDLQTGVEGLGKICRTFEGVFSMHPRDAVNRTTGHLGNVEDALRLKGARVAIHRSKYVSPLSIPPSWENALNKIYPLSREDNTTQDNDVEMQVEKDDDDERHEQPKPNIYLVKGPKKVGKSSFARILLNRLLSKHDRVAYLECDLGQSEFTPGGLVALNVIQKTQPLLGPPFTHPAIPTRAHFLGAFSPKSCPGHYVEAIGDLAGYWARELGAVSTVPLVVNTMGWTKGLGGDLTKKIEDILFDSLSEVSLEFSLSHGLSEEESGPEMHLYGFDYDATGDSIAAPTDPQTWPNSESNLRTPSYSMFVGGNSHNFAYSTRPASAIHSHRMETALTFVSSSTSGLPYASSATTGPLTSFTPADHRSLNILSYFHATFPLFVLPSPNPNQTQFPDTIAMHWDTSLPLIARPPYEVDVNAAVDRVILLPGTGDEGAVVESEIERVLGGALVGLVKCEPGTLDVDPNSGERNLIKSTKIPYFPSTPSSFGSPTHQHLSPNTSCAYGLALVRNVAPGGSHLHVLTPLPASLLAQCGRVMVKGEMELPIWGMVDHRSMARIEREKDIPFLQWDKGVGLGAEKRRVRRNLMRKNQGV